MNKLSIFILSSIFVTGAFAASHTGGSPMAPSATKMPEAEMSRNPKAEAAAERKHQAKTHGTDKSAKQPEAEMQANSKAQAAGEAKHKAKSHGDVVKSIPLENGSTVFVFKDGKMGMEDKMGRSTRMKPGHVMKAKDGTALMMVGDEVMRVESLLTERKGTGNN